MTEPSPNPAILAALDSLLGALALEPTGEDRFCATNELPRFPRLFGGQLVAQALAAMSATADGKVPHSVHAQFVDGGDLEHGLELHVERIRDGRSLSARRVTVSQDGRTILIASASFERTWPPSPTPAEPLDPQAPEELPTLQDWARDAVASRGDFARTWIDVPPPLDVRIGEATTFLGGAHARGPRRHWLRLPRPVGDDAVLHQVLLAYASDYFLSDMTVRNHPDGLDGRQLLTSTLDHALWFHRPVRFDRWHRYTQEVRAVDGQRGLVLGSLHDQDGFLVATAAQEVLVRPLAGP